MGFIKTHKTSIVALVFLGTIYFASRILFLTKLPIFTDEAIYLRWAQIALHDHNWLFISLSDGKQPLFVWLMAAAMAFIKDPLFAGRIISVFAGFFTMIGLFFLGRETFKSNKIGIISSFIYIVYPFALVYDRMALYDSLVGTFGVWSIYLVFRLIKKPNLVNTILLGVIAGVSNLNKSNFFLTILLSPLFLFVYSWKNFNSFKKMLTPVGLIIFSGVISFVIYSTLRVSPLFYIINQKNAVFIYPLKEWIMNPFQAVLGNFPSLWGWFVSYTGYLAIFVVVLGLLCDKKFIREKIILVSWFVIPFVILAFVGRVIYPRYILFMAISLIPIASYGLVGIKNVLKNKFVLGALIIITVFPFLKTDFYIITDFPKADIPLTDKFQYSIGWPAGNGISESVEFFKRESNKGPIFIGTGGTFGLLPMSYDIYLSDNPNIKTKGYWPIEVTPPADLMELKKKETVYFVFYQPCPSCKLIGDAPPSWGLTKIISYPKDQSNLTIYKF